jgi:GT2 family glycosyltransferase
MMHGPGSVSFVIPVRDDSVRLRRCLDSILANSRSPRDLEIIVADNGSTDDSRQVAMAAGATTLELPGLPVAELRNRGASAAAGDVLAFVDADHEITPQWVASAVAVLSDSNVGAAGAIYTPPPQGSWVQRMYGVLRGHTVGQGDVDWLGSGNLAVRRSAFDAVSGFDTSLTTCEDVDLCQRLKAAGWRVVGDERLASIHFGDPATLSTLFRAERWRGRDNIRVTLRGKFTLRDLPSLLIPCLDAILAMAALAALVLVPVSGAPAIQIAAIAVAIVAGLALLRTARMVWATRDFSPVTLGRAFLVAATYDLGRAAALVTRSSHHRRGAPRRFRAGAPLT